jgi:hypothetical protein
MIFEREAKTVICPACNILTADRVRCTPEEIRLYGCGRDSECCARAFVCTVCGTRTAGTVEAPDWDDETWDFGEEDEKETHP